MAHVEDPEVVELLQALIRNACVNDGTDASGGEASSAGVIASVLGEHVDTQWFEPSPGRASLVARLEGRDPGAPSLCYLAHTDVVPVNEARWRRDPFGGELVDGEVWGRGAVDMLNLTSSMSLAFARIARAGIVPRGSLVLAVVADEEATGAYGAGWLVEHALDAVEADYVITEFGGTPLAMPGGKLLPVPVAEKGSCWCRLRVHGNPGHASQPLRTDNALVTAAEVVRRLAAARVAPEIHDAWRTFVLAAGMPAEVERALLDPSAIDDLVDTLPDVALARQAHACTHTTLAPTIVHGGTKINVIPDTVEIDVDIRTMPGWTEADVRRLLDDVLGDLGSKVSVVGTVDDPATASSTDTPLWAAMERVASRFHPDGRLVPMLEAGATDARFFRRKGVPSYGFGMFTDRISFEQFSAMFHGDDERIDVESLAWSAAAFEQLARDFLS